MKVTNLILAALVAVAAPTFANTQAAEVVSKAAVESVLANSATRAATLQLAKQLGVSTVGIAEASLAASLVSKLNASKDQQVLNLAKSIQAGKATSSQITTVASAMSAMPVEQNDSKNTTSQGRKLGQRTDNSENPDRVSGDLDRSRDNDRLDSLRTSCSATGGVAILTGACGHITDKAAVWDQASANIVSAANSRGIVTQADALKNKDGFTQSVIDGMASVFAKGKARTAAVCSDIKQRVIGLSASLKESADNCQVINRAGLNLSNFDALCVASR